jgi:creatinine amidohydrolase
VTAGLVRFDELRSPDVGEAGAGAVCLLPVGAVEPHGPHAPLGTDTLISEAVCAAAAAELDADGVRVLVLPPLSYGVTAFSAMFPGSVGVSARTLEAAVADICGALDAQGVARRVIVNSHFEPEHVVALRRAADRTRSALFDITRRRMAERLTDEFRSGAAHAGRYETSLVLALRPELVDTERMQTLQPLHVDMPAEMRAGKDSFTAMGMHDAYCGAPAEATAEEGRETLRTLTVLLVELIRESGDIAAG